jgi:hypothetical protein
MFLNRFFNFLPVQMVIRSDRSSRPRLVVHIQIFAIIPWFSHPTAQFSCPQYLHHKRPILVGQLWRVSLLGVKNSTTIPFDALQHSWKWTIHYEHNTIHPKANEAQRTTNKLGQVLLQGHIACTRYLHRGITFQTPLAARIQQFMKPSSLNNEKFQFKTALRRFLNTQASSSFEEFLTFRRTHIISCLQWIMYNIWMLYAVYL